MCKIQFQDNDSESEEEFADFNVQETCSRMIPVSSSSKSVKIRFQYPDSNTSGDDESIQNEDEIDKQLTEIFGDLSEETSQPCSETSSEYTNNCSIGTVKLLGACVIKIIISIFYFLAIQKSPTTKMMKIHYQDYQRRILTSEMKSIMHQSYLTDVQFVCHDGLVYGNSLILGSMSHFLYNILAEVPIVDKVKIVIMPDISSADLNALFKQLFNSNESVSVKDIQKIKNLAKIFQIETILVLTRKPGRPKGSLNKPKSKISENVSKFSSKNSSQQILNSEESIKTPENNIVNSDSQDNSENEFEDILETNSTNDKLNEETIEYFDPNDDQIEKTNSDQVVLNVHNESMNPNLLNSELLIDSLNQTGNSGSDS